MTQAVLVPTMIQQLLAEAKEHFPGRERLALQRFWSIGAPLPVPLRGRIQEAFRIPIYEVRSL